MKLYDAKFWDKTWSRNYGRYNRHHALMWEAVLPYLKGKILDIGCGPCMLYKDKNVDLIGVDFSTNALLEAQKNYPQGTYLVADVNCLPFIEKQFDTIIMLGLLDYFEMWDEIIKSTRALLKPGGNIIISLLNGYGMRFWNEDSVIAKIGFQPKIYTEVTSQWRVIVL